MFGGPVEPPLSFLRKQLPVEQQVKIVRGRIVIDEARGAAREAVPSPDWVPWSLPTTCGQRPTGLDVVEQIWPFRPTRGKAKVRL